MIEEISSLKKRIKDVSFHNEGDREGSFVWKRGQRSFLYLMIEFGGEEEKGGRNREMSFLRRG